MKLLKCHCGAVEAVINTSDNLEKILRCNCTLCKRKGAVMVNLGNMMKQAQQLQKKMADAQEKLNTIEVEGVSGGGVVKVTATAK